MFRVVGCSECDTLWIVEDEPETTQCPRCRTRHKFGRLQAFVTTDSKDEAREVRSAMLAARQDESEAYESLDSVSDMETILEEAGIDDAEFLTEMGIDTEAVEKAGKSATETRTRPSRRDRVLDALREFEEPTESEIVEYATDRGVPASYVRSALDKLERRGEVARTSDGYRLV